MEERQWSGPPRIPAEVRNSAVETLAKSKAAGSHRLRRASRRRASYDGLTKQETPPSPKKAVPITSTGRGDKTGDVQPSPPPPPPLKAASSPPARPAVRRCVSVGEMSTARSADPLSAGSVFISTALRRGHLSPRENPRENGADKDNKTGQQQEEKARGRGRSRGRSPGPSLTRRVSASASPRGHGGGERAAIERGVSTDGYESSDNKRGDSRSFYEYWSYYNYRPASVVRSATSEMANDILSPADDGEITAPIPSATVTTKRERPTTTAETTGASESAGVSMNARKRAQVAGQAARTARAIAVAEERWAKEAKHRVQELRKHSGNSRCADCGAPCADWASVAHGSFVCLSCAGQHRSLGMHVTFTRSLTMDKWTEGDLRIMEAGGNGRLAEFVRRIGLYPWSTIQGKYEHPCLLLYRNHLAALADGEEPPPISREALEKAVLAASGEEASDLDDGEHDASTSSTSTSSSLNSDEGGEATRVQLKNLIRNVSGGCGGIGHVLRRWSCNNTAARRARTGGRGEGGPEAEACEDGSAGAVRGAGEAPRWIPDDEEEACMLCDRKFTLVLRRHHCRRCGRLSCNLCAPTNNTRPIVEWGFPQAVRHCRLCYRSPLLEWPDRPTD
eukprot:g15763.t1